MKPLQAWDVDTDALADTFERIAEGLRENEVLLKEVNTGHRARVDEDSEFDLAITFVASHDFADVVDAIEYETDQTKPDNE